MNKHSIKILVKESNINFHNWYTTAESFHHPIFKKIIGGIIPRWVMKIEHDSGQWGVIEAEWQKASELFAQRMEAGKIDIFDVEQKHYLFGKKIRQLTDFVYKNKLHAAPVSRLQAILKQMWEAYYFLNGIGYVAVISDLGHGYLLGQLSKILLQKNVPVDKIQKYQSLLSSPNKESFFLKEKLELSKLCFKNKTLAKLKQSTEFEKHVNKWFWLNYGYQGPVWTKDDFLNRAGEIFKEKSLSKSIGKQQAELPLLRRKQKTLSKKLKLSEKENYFFKTARLFTFLKGYRIETRHRYSYALDQIFVELGKRFHLPLSFFRYATKGEIVSAISGKKIQSEKILKRRQNMLYILDGFKGSFIKFDSVDKTFASLLAEEKIEFSDSVTGQTAYPGKVKGMVKILNSIEDAAKIRTGDILVTFATAPDFLPAMTKAAAFVTDQGGITSHAAITARELKKPCVIGTRIATKIFKDGDMVEVNANTGIVNKLYNR